MAKAKDGSECFTRTNKSGGKYTTCKGTQKGDVKMSSNKKVTLAQQEKSKAAAAKRKAKAKPKPKKTPKTREQLVADKVKKLDGEDLSYLEKIVREYGTHWMPAGKRNEIERDAAKIIIENKKGRVTGPNGGVDRFAPTTISQSRQNEMEDMMEYMTFSGQMPMGSMDPDFIKFQARRRAPEKAVRVTLPDGTILEQTKDGARVVSD